MSPRRFPPSWTAEKTEAHFIVRDATGKRSDIASLLGVLGCLTLAVIHREAWRRLGLTGSRTSGENAGKPPQNTGSWCPAP